MPRWRRQNAGLAGEARWSRSQRLSLPSGSDIQRPLSSDTPDRRDALHMLALLAVADLREPGRSFVRTCPAGFSHRGNDLATTRICKSIACMWLGGLSTSWPGESRDCPARHVPGQSGLLLARNRPASGPDMRTQCPPACSVRDNANEQAQRNGAVGIALHTATRPHGAAKACRTAVGVSGPTLISRRFAVVNHFHDVRTRSRTNRVIRSAEYVGRFGYP
jgi:hypothetical protein